MARELDHDQLGGRWFRAVRGGQVRRVDDGTPDGAWALTHHGHSYARVQAQALGLDPDQLTTAQLVSLACYDSPEYVDRGRVRR